MYILPRIRGAPREDNSQAGLDALHRPHRQEVPRRPLRLRQGIQVSRTARGEAAVDCPEGVEDAGVEAGLADQKTHVNLEKSQIVDVEENSKYELL